MTIAIVIIHSDEGTGESEGFAVGYKERGINDAGGGKCQPCYKQGASEDAHCCSEVQLYAGVESHVNELSELNKSLDKVSQQLPTTINNYIDLF